MFEDAVRKHIEAKDDDCRKSPLFPLLVPF